MARIIMTVGDGSGQFALERKCKPRSWIGLRTCLLRRLFPPRADAMNLGQHRIAVLAVLGLGELRLEFGHLVGSGTPAAQFDLPFDHGFDSWLGGEFLSSAVACYNSNAGCFGFWSTHCINRQEVGNPRQAVSTRLQEPGFSRGPSFSKWEVVPM